MKASSHRASRGRIENMAYNGEEGNTSQKDSNITLPLLFL